MAAQFRPRQKGLMGFGPCLAPGVHLFPVIFTLDLDPACFSGLFCLF